ncbi:hypothetical protein F3Y22_tig00110270pilonHSYRG00016 [Hibiscus syriacus]|uniref:HIG1 domain-containing protein n=1 Tax=Hibiscus syriacus TaxID=106335 RepID=A0A6A3B530_HIBSY|nr:hypothetical protein F3Y22_tig00110270pilonHSYRG00016 [Hibiscus syriacus]
MIRKIGRTAGATTVVVARMTSSKGISNWGGGGASLAYNSWGRSSLKPSPRLIHARMHSQALTLAVLSGAAAYHYYEKNASTQDRITTNA